jgi:uncharacterized protein YutE (UPF0331/DUF86 family)
MNTTQYIVQQENGDIEYFKDKELSVLHREDGPARIMDSNTERAWYTDGKLHRLDGPAYENVVGDEEWRVNGMLHRIGGPAVVYENRALPNEWWVNGSQVCKGVKDKPKVEARKYSLQELLDSVTDEADCGTDWCKDLLDESPPTELEVATDPTKRVLQLSEQFQDLLTEDEWKRVSRNGQLLVQEVIDLLLHTDIVKLQCGYTDFNENGTPTEVSVETHATVSPEFFKGKNRPTTPKKG